MENASKALIMAGGVLIGILILSLAVYLFIDFGEQAAVIHDRITSNQLTQFNAQFNVYAERQDVTIYQIISLVNLAQENNAEHQEDGVFESDYKIDILLGGSNITTLGEESKLTLITTNNDVEPTTDENGNPIVVSKVKYTCTGVEYHDNRKSFESFF